MTDRPLALVTGATAGIGLSFARALAAQGYDLCLIARDAGRLATVAAELSRPSGPSVQWHSADLSTDGGIAAVAPLIAELPRLDLLVNNAGFGTQGRFHRTPDGSQRVMTRLLAEAPVALCRAAIPGMVARGRGAIINVSSIAGFLQSPGNVTYCAAKAFLTSFTLGLDVELAGTGVRVQALCPGFTRTEFHERMDFDQGRIPGWLWQGADEVVARSLAQLARGGAVICLPSFTVRLIRWGVRVVPRGVMKHLAVRRRR
ncbi:MAG: SDR family NAD(P)-dependent oxidoreductase [Gemmatimonadaceae bacterium]|nr:SDR family NAD(P)-dependent oxidoreductase [Gemmatimonadaceae bacterium]